MGNAAAFSLSLTWTINLMHMYLAMRQGLKEEEQSVFREQLSSLEQYRVQLQRQGGARHHQRVREGAELGISRRGGVRYP